MNLFQKILQKDNGECCLNFLTSFRELKFFPCHVWAKFQNDTVVAEGNILESIGAAVRGWTLNLRGQIGSF